MRILVVTQYFWPENFRINDLCAELVSRGHEVTVLTGKPNYPEGNVFVEYVSNPSNFNEYAGCKVVRVPMMVRGQASSIKLMLNYLTFALSAMLIGAWKLKKKPFDVIFVYEPSPVTVGLPAVFLKKLKKAPVVFWVLDLWPETLEAVGVLTSKRGLHLVGRLVAFIYNRCDLVLGQSQSFHLGISKYCQDRSKIRCFPSWSEIFFEDVGVYPVKKIADYDGFKVVFTGNVGESQDFPSILNAVARLKAKEVKIKLFIVGDGRALDWVRTEIEKQDLSNHIMLLGRHPLEAMPSFYLAADALLVTLKKNPVFAMTIPGKVQPYMLAGKPILTMLTGEGSKVVREAACGFTADSGDVESFANNLIKMSRLSIQERLELGENAKKYADKKFNRNVLICQLESWFEEVSILFEKK